MSSKNKKNFKVIVVGSGLPSLNFIDSFLKRNKQIDVISPDFEQELNESNNFNSHLFKIFPTPGIKKKIKKYNNNNSSKMKTKLISILNLDLVKIFLYFLIIKFPYF